MRQFKDQMDCKFTEPNVKWRKEVGKTVTELKNLPTADIELLWYRLSRSSDGTKKPRTEKRDAVDS